MKKILKKRKFCECGCGIVVKGDRRFVNHHYSKTEEYRRIASNNLKNLWETQHDIFSDNQSKICSDGAKANWSKNREILIQAGIKGRKRTWELHKDKLSKLSSERMKNKWENDREKLMKNQRSGYKKWAKENPEKAYEQGCESVKGLLKWQKENPEKVYENASKGGKIGGKNAWENNYEVMNRNRNNNIKNLWEGNYKLRKKYSKMMKDRWKNNYEMMVEGAKKGGRIIGPANMAKLMGSKPSFLELTVRNFLKSKNIEHRHNIWFPYNGTKKEADIVIDKSNLIVECDGCMHKREEIKSNDEIKNKLFNQLGYKVLRLSWEEIRSGKFQQRLLRSI